MFSHFLENDILTPLQSGFIPGDSTVNQNGEGNYSSSIIHFVKVSKSAKIRNRYNQVPHLTQDTNGKVTNLQ